MCQGWNCQATDNKRRNCHYRGNEGFFSPFLDSPRPPSPLFCTCDSIATPFRLSPAAAPSKRDSDRQVAPGEGRGHTNKGRGERPVTSFFCHWCHYVTATNNRLLARARRSYGGAFIGCSFFSSFLGCVPSSLSPSLCSSPALAAFT